MSDVAAALKEMDENVKRTKKHVAERRQVEQLQAEPSGNIKDDEYLCWDMTNHVWRRVTVDKYRCLNCNTFKVRK